MLDTMRQLLDRIPGVYAFIDPRTGKVRYIGLTKGCVDERYAFHRRDARCPEDRRPITHWLRKLTRLGLTPALELLEYYPFERAGLNERERWWIAEYRARGEADLNMTDGGDGGCGPVSAATRAKISAALKGKQKPPRSAEHRVNLGTAAKGRKLSAEHRAKIGAAHKGSHRTDATKAKMAESRRRLYANLTPEERRVMRGPGHTPEAKAKISAALKGKPISPEHREKIRATVARVATTEAFIAACSRGGKTSWAHRHGVEVEPGLWLSRKTGKVLLDQRR